ncbi:hypothetical protein BST22_17495 [Mycolicibacterium chubuense]|uniref:Uncharacterized protein n=2 Tax=Mycolicibacterium chubuense TaxID=1800 RepID=A0A0J6VUF8_MYCCU|nr:hypothetical protein [Mycolicibacterium chubuense]KMO73097.1 hypothetical protein MCHUDSM44219_04274 [Mycolicibacterium chubuense]ORA49333.1 hypothetical protein BST22_17495 [Mycolicibacterium chubuense]SPX98634.1 Uncharacterised protein [Mycolicibacterium chubuense]
MTHSRQDMTLLAQGSEGGGAEISQVIGLSAVAMAVTAVLLWIGYLHRQRKISWLENLAEWLGRRFKRPPWVALPIAIFVSAIICALFGFIWDVSLHIGKGRDPGPLANPAHYFIIVGLFFVFIAGCTAIVLPFDKPGPAAVRITDHWYAPVGGIVMAGCGMYALIGFPLDDVWHRIFGQDVTLWGPTHLMMIGGAGFSTIAAAYLEFEGKRAVGSDAPRDGIGLKFIQYLAFAGVLIGLSVYQIEFDFGVPQFRQVFQPMLIAAAASVALVAARIYLGRGAALISAIVAIGLRGIIAFLVAPLLEAPVNWFALYLGPALVVELVALTPLFKRPVLFGLVSGLGVATVGLWLESFWIDAVYFYPWPTSIWPEALSMAVPVAILAGGCGAMIGMVLTGQRLPRRAISVGLVVLTVLAIGGATANGLRYSVPQNETATFALTETQGPGPGRFVTADVRFNPPNAISDDPNWVSVLAWQGGLANERGQFIDHLDRVGPGHYVSTKPMPVSGQWKTLLRVHDGTTLTAVPIYLAGDPGIGAEEVPAEAQFTRPFVSEITILQRERSPDIPASLWLIGCLIVLVCTLAMIAGISWGGGRINQSESSGSEAEFEPSGQS